MQQDLGGDDEIDRLHHGLLHRGDLLQVINPQAGRNDDATTGLAGHWVTSR